MFIIGSYCLYLSLYCNLNIIFYFLMILFLLKVDIKLWGIGGNLENLILR